VGLFTNPLVAVGRGTGTLPPSLLHDPSTQIKRFLPKQKELTISSSRNPKRSRLQQQQQQQQQHQTHSTITTMKLSNMITTIVLNVLLLASAAAHNNMNEDASLNAVQDNRQLTVNECQATINNVWLVDNRDTPTVLDHVAPGDFINISHLPSVWKTKIVADTNVVPEGTPPAAGIKFYLDGTYIGQNNNPHWAYLYLFKLYMKGLGEKCLTLIPYCEGVNQYNGIPYPVCFTLEESGVLPVDFGVTKVSIYDKDSDTKVKDLYDGQHIDMCCFDFNWEIRAWTFPDEIGSVKFEVDGVNRKTDSWLDYAINSGDMGIVSGQELTLNVRSFAESGGQGTEGGNLELNLTFWDCVENTPGRRALTTSVTSCECYGGGGRRALTGGVCCPGGEGRRGLTGGEC
jgi:hypothetical protein